jgi:hypothetical protein
VANQFSAAYLLPPHGGLLPEFPYPGPPVPYGSA